MKNKYVKLLNNLLNINLRGDQAIFTKVKNIDSFDVFLKFGKDISDKIINQKTFNINLEEKDLEKIIENIPKCKNDLELLNLLKENNENLSNSKKLLLSNPKTFEETKQKILEDFISKNNKIFTRWKQFKAKATDKNIQENIWTLHIATCFLTIQLDDKTLYSPLLLKEVELDIDKKIILRTDFSWKLNEKLIFLLSDKEIILNLDNNDFVDKNLKEILSFLSTKFKKDLSVEQFLKPFVHLDKGNIQNKNLEFMPGLVLGMFQPEGGALRKKLLEIIENDEIDEVFDPEIDKNIYEENISNAFSNNYDLVQIQKSNFSQNKALVSSLIQDTIIWGPPGTGKSQVISNIIANILYRNKSAIVVSQKKAALDVLKKRLNLLAPFVFFGLNDNKMNKQEFYKPLNAFIWYIENNNAPISKNNFSLISEEELHALKNVINFKKNKSYNASLKILNEFVSEKDNIVPFESVENFMQLDHTKNYDFKNDDLNQYIDLYMKNNSIQKSGFWIFKKYPKLEKNNSLNAFKLQNYEIEKIKHFIPDTNIETIKQIIFANKFLHNQEKGKKFHSDENYLILSLSNRIKHLLNSWKTENKEYLKLYKKFANAIRASKRLPHKFMEIHKEIISILFPIIVTTPENINFSNKKQTIDYVIVDESSQMFLEIGLPILWSAKIKILAGDPEQMKPSKWFSTRDESSDELEDEELAENSESLLDYVIEKGGFQVMLNQNYRSSSASLMSFSSKKFYNSQLEVIDFNKNHDNSAIEVINVDGKWENSSNIVEIEKVLELTKDNINKYDSIILLTFNAKQRQILETFIFEDLNLYEELKSEKLMIRNIENIQGDEADLVIATIAYDKTTPMGATYVSRPGGKNALNVAISRAKEKMIVVKSVSSFELRHANSEDYQIFKEWLEFLDLDPLIQRKYSLLEENQKDENYFKINELYGEVDSDFEKDVIENIIANIKTIKPINIIKQFEVGSKKIDIAFVDKNNSFILGIEVDGYRYHEGQGYKKYLDDISRQEFLEMKGYTIFRVKEIEWKINKKNVISKIQVLLNSLLN